MTVERRQGNTYYVNSNLDLFWLAARELDVKFADIDRIDRTDRTVHLFDGTVLEMPADWNVS